jgi:hypothetical protein
VTPISQIEDFGLGNGGYQLSERSKMLSGKVEVLLHSGQEAREPIAGL